MANMFKMHFQLLIVSIGNVKLGKEKDSEQRISKDVPEGEPLSSDMIRKSELWKELGKEDSRSRA